ncbi:hypothetical protein FJY69_07730 [candidate division WOR-3 bacterium]|nr:hypothetical protein [candidate division WOR-3 bacterium]
MASCEYTCVECGHTFEVFGVESELDERMEVECPLCGSEECTRTYEERETEGDDWKEDQDSPDINLDDE